MSSLEAMAHSEHEFLKARRKAFFSSVFARVKGQDLDLLSYEEVKSLLKPTGESYRGQQTIDVDKIVGSEGRYLDFDHRFLPRKSHTKKRARLIRLSFKP